MSKKLANFKVDGSNFERGNSEDDQDNSKTIEMFARLDDEFYKELKRRKAVSEQAFKEKHRNRIPLYIGLLIGFLVIIFFGVIPNGAVASLPGSHLFSSHEWFVNYLEQLAAIIQPAGMAILAGLVTKLIGVFLAVFKKYVNDEENEENK